MSHNPERIEQLHLGLRAIHEGLVANLVERAGLSSAVAHRVALDATLQQFALKQIDECPECGHPEVEAIVADVGHGPEVRVISGCAPTCSTQERGNH